MAGYDPCDSGCHVNCLEREGVLLADAAAQAGLDAAVPSCPGWRVRDMLAHTGYVHRWAAGFVAEQRTTPVDTPDEAGVLALAPSDDTLLGWFRDGHAALVRTLREAQPGVQCWSFLPAPSPLAFWARRQAHETAIHRADAELAASAAGAASGLSAYPAGFAADGVDELLLGFLARSMKRGRWQGRPGTLGIHADDGAAGRADWLVVTGQDGLSVTRGEGPADCDVTAPAATLYLALWNRGPVTGLEVRGDPAFLDAFRSGLQVTWS